MGKNRKWLLVLLAVVVLPVLGFRLPAERPGAPLPVATPLPTPVPTPEPTPVPTPTPEPTSSPAPEKLIALSFDDGPGVATRRILKAMDAVDGRATFFMLGNRMDSWAETARAVAEQGSEIGTHSWSHPNLAKLSADGVRRQLASSVEAIRRVTGVRPKLLRPPYGSVSQELLRAAEDMGLVVANWNVDPEDWRVRDAETIRRRILANARDGAIVVCHDVYPETAAAMEAVIRDLDARGYRLVTVSELLASRAGGMEAGRVYYAA